MESPTSVALIGRGRLLLNAGNNKEACIRAAQVTTERLSTVFSFTLPTPLVP